MSVLVNQTGTIAIILNGMTSNVTGSVFLTFFCIFILLIALALIFKLPIELAIVFHIPLLLTLMAYPLENGGSWTAIGGMILIYSAFLLAKYVFSGRNA